MFVWDIPLRLFHWLLVLGVLFGFLSSQLGGSWLDSHVRIGEFIFSLLLFRIIWGFIGNHYAKFVQFFPTHKRLKKYFLGQWREPGHTPLGGLSVFFMLVALLLQCIFGMFSINDEIETHGPLYPLISNQISEQFTHWHHLFFYIPVFLIILHVSAIYYYDRIKKTGLTKSMLTGKIVQSEQQNSSFPVLRFLTAALFAALIFWLLDSGFLTQTFTVTPNTSQQSLPDW